MTRAALMVILLAWPLVSPAADLSGMYGEELLRHWQGRYHRSIFGNLKEVIWPVLDESERAALAGVALEVPLPNELPQEGRGDPFLFYATVDQKVVMPTLSVNFFADLCAASAWLDLKGYETTAVTDYIAMLKYNRTVQHYPVPFEALGVPEEAWEDPVVSETAQTCLGTGIIFILTHELGHIYHGHRGYEGISREQAQRNEAAADAFAIDIMRRIGDMPAGMAHWLLFATYWAANRADFTTEEEWKVHLRDENTHPLTGTRLRLVAAEMRDAANDFARSAPDYQVAVRAALSIAKEMEIIAGLLDNSDLQQFIAYRGRNTDLDDLRPVSKGSKR